MFLVADVFKAFVKSANIPGGAYHLGSSQRDEGHWLFQHGDGWWEVDFVERGEARLLRRFRSYDAAMLFLMSELCEAYCVHPLAPDRLPRSSGGRH